MHSLTVRAFTAMIEWVILSSFIATFALVANDLAGVVTNVGAIVTVALSGLVSVSVASTRRFQLAWLTGGAMIALGGAITFLVAGASTFDLTFPLFGAFYLLRVMRLQDCEDPGELAVKWFRMETGLFPVFIAGCLFLAPANYILPRGLWVISAVVYYLARMLSLLTLQRVGLERNNYRPWRELVAVAFLAIFVVGIVLMSSYTSYLSALLYPIVHLLDILNNPKSQGGIGGQSGYGDIRGSMKSLHFQKGSPPAPLLIPHWVYVCAIVAAIAFFVWWFFRKTPTFEGMRDSHDIHVELSRQRWVGRLSLRNSQSHVIRTYQRFLRLMEKQRLPVRVDETAREYSQRLQKAPDHESDFSRGVDLLTQAYENVRYQDVEAKSQWTKDVDRGYQIVEKAMKATDRR